MINKIQFFRSKWNSTYDYYKIFYDSGHERTYKSPPKSARKFLQGKFTSNPDPDHCSGYIVFDMI